MKTFVKRLLRSTRGATAVEYGLICSLIVLAMLVGLQNFANATQTMWGDVSNKTQNAVNQASGS